jgi:hypothetical protein
MAAVLDMCTLPLQLTTKSIAVHRWLNVAPEVPGVRFK